MGPGCTWNQIARKIGKVNRPALARASCPCESLRPEVLLYPDAGATVKIIANTGQAFIVSRCESDFPLSRMSRILSMTDVRYRINSAKIAAETIEGEVVIVNFVTGAYYSLNGLAAEIWAWMTSGHSLPEVAEHLRSLDAALEVRAIEEFIAAIVNDDLLEIDPAVTAPKSSLSPPAATAPFSAPVLEKHDDMRELILLDPIHEVGESGWPHRK